MYIIKRTKRPSSAFLLFRSCSRRAAVFLRLSHYTREHVRMCVALATEQLN